MKFMNALPQNEIKTVLAYGAISILILLPYIKVYNNPDFTIDKLTLLFSALLISSAVLNYWFFSLASLFIVLVSVVFLHITHTWGVWQIGQRISVALESPTSEMSEYLSSYLGYFDAIILLYAITCLLAVHRTRNFKINSKKYKIIAGIYITLFPVILSSNPDRLTKDGYPITAIPLEAVNTYQRLSHLSNRKDLIDNIRKPSDCPKSYNQIVIVMGESVNKNRMSLYGYNKVTTPFLDSLSAIKLNAISPADTTRYSIPMELTRATPGEFSTFFSSPSIITDLRDCGYDTYWLSNQGDRGKWNTYVRSIADEAKNTVFLDDTNPYDGALIPLLDKVLTIPSRTKAIFIHLNGSHFRYSARYPRNFSRINGDNIPESYDTSVLYTDHVLSQIFDKLDKDSLLFVYTSDHGEVVSSEVFGHGISPGYKAEYDIPLVIWSSNTKKLNNILRLNKTTLLNGSNLYELLRYLVDIDPILAVSNDDTVSEVGPDNLVSYEQLPRYHK